MKKRFLITVLGLSMSAVLFSACGSKKENTETTTQTVAETKGKADKTRPNDLPHHSLYLLLQLPLYSTLQW